MKGRISFAKTIEMLKESHYDVYANLKYDIITDFDILILKKVYSGYTKPFDELIEFFESTEEYEKCKKLLDIKEKLI